MAGSESTAPPSMRGKRPQQDAQDDHGLETDVRRIKVGHDQANPHPSVSGIQRKASSPIVWLGGAALGEQKALEGQGPGGHRRNCGGHAQLDQQ